MSKRKVRIVPPERFENLKLGPPKRKAVGLKAIQSSFKHISEEMGFVRGLKLLSKMNQKHGFDCPGCAWPDPDGHRSKLGEYCENGAKAIAEEATNKRVDRHFFQKHSVEFLSEQTDYWIGKSGRLTEPMYLPSGKSHYEPITWEKAFEKIASKLKSLPNPDEAVFYTSGRTSNEAAYMYQLMIRMYGTNNLPDCSNMCHESSGSGLSTTVGIGKGSVTLEDLYQAEVIVVMGQNPGTNHPRMLAALAKCKKNGGTIVGVNPINESGTQNFTDPQSPLDVFKGGTDLQDLFLQVKINGDVALLKATMFLMLEAEEKAPGTIFDHEFIKEYCLDYDSFIAHLKTVNYQEAVEQSGLSDADVKTFANLLIQKKKIIICWAMGITQQKNGVGNVQEIVNLLLLKGSIGKPGAGTCPVRGHSNVQGDRTMGIWEKPPASFLDSLDERFKFKSPRNHGFDVVDAIKAMNSDQVKVFIGLGGNFISATPDSQLTGEAMQKVDLTVQVSTKLNRSHLVTGNEAIILPCISRSEEDVQSSGQQFVTVENSMGVVHSSKGTFKPASENLLSEPAIVGQLGETLFEDKKLWQDMVANYDVVRDHIEATIPGFDNYNKRVLNPAGFYLPNGSRNRAFTTASGKAHFSINPIPDNKLEDNHFILMTVRTHDQYNTTIYGMDDRYRGIFNERRVILMHPDDMASQGLDSEDIVNLISHFNGEKRHANNFKVVKYQIAKGCIGSYFPETNVLVPIDSVAEKSNTPVSKFIDVTLEKVNL
ncbi:MAG: FdhF/YdeP family oxidoreductase [Crocinitomicaceae bacterium]